MNREAGAVLVGFLNTVYLPDGVDALAGSTPEQWLADGLVDSGRSVEGEPDVRSDVDDPALQRVRDLRSGLRVLTRPDRSGDPGQQAEVDRAGQVLQAVPLIVRLPQDRTEQVRLTAAREADEVSDQIAAVAEAYFRSTTDDTFARVKTCALIECQWAFLDVSRNRSRRWCAMQECGNRAKNRAYRARRADPS